MRNPFHGLVIGMILIGAWAAPLTGSAPQISAAPARAYSVLAATPPAPAQLSPTPAPAPPVTSTSTTIPWILSLLALVLSAAVVAGLWVLTRASRTLPGGEGLVVVQVIFGTTLAGLLLALIWLWGDAASLAALCMGSLVIFAELLIMIATVSNGQAFARDRAQMLAGQSLAHWAISAEEHRQFVAGQAQRTARLAWGWLGGTALVGLAGSALGARAAALVLVEAGLLGTAVAAVQALHLRAKLASGSDLGPGQLTLSANGALLFGHYTPLQLGKSLWVEQVSLAEGEPLRLKFKTYHTGGKGGGYADIFFPVPPERRAEAEALAASYPVKKA